jgi:hypothetical protein
MTVGEFFDQVRDAMFGIVEQHYTPFESYAHGYGLKLWFPGAEREHYEAQLVRGSRAGVAALEIGFHAEHKDNARNDALLAALLQRERSWRKLLGKEPVAGPFLGSQRPGWRRVSELWDEPELDDPGNVFDVAGRLGCYIAAIEPARRRLAATT